MPAGFNVQPIMLTAGVLYSLLSVTVWTLLHRRHHPLPVLLWSSGAMAAGLGTTLIAARAALPDWISFSVANSLLYASLVLRIGALRFDLGLPLRAGHGAALWALASAGYWWCTRMEVPAARVFFTTAVLALGTAAFAASAATVARVTALRSAKVLAWVEGLLAGTLALRLLAMGLGWTAAHGISQSWDFVLLILVAAAAALYGNLGYLGMVLDRARAAQALAQGAQRTEAAGRLAAEQAANELRSLLDQRDRLAAERDHLLQVLAHEIRQPVHNASGALQAAASALESPDLSGSTRAAVSLQRAQAMLGTMQAVLDNALAGAALLTRNEPLLLQEVDIDFLVGLALGDLPATQRDRVTVTWTCTLRSVDCEPNLVRLALRNLLRNAFLHGGEGVAVQLRVSESSAPPAMVLAVADNGKGVGAAMLRELAMPAPDLASPLTPRGLGLYIARRVMALHGGQLRLAANQPQGLVATLVFPLPDDDAAAVAAAAVSAPRPAARS